MFRSRDRQIAYRPNPPKGFRGVTDPYWQETHYDRFVALDPTAIGRSVAVIADLLKRSNRDPTNVMDFAIAAETLLPGIASATSDPMLGPLFHLLRFTVAFKYFGQIVYVVTPQLTEVLLQTTLRRVPAEALKLPAKAFYVALPDVVPIMDAQTGAHPLCGMYVLDSIDGHGRDGLRFAFIGAANENSIASTDDRYFYFTLPYNELANISDIEGVLHRLLDIDHEAGLNTKLDQPIENIKIMAHLALNTIMYITSETADVIQRYNPEWEAAYNKLKAYKARNARPDKILREEHKLRESGGPRLRYILGSQIQRDFARIPPQESQGGTHASPVRHHVDPYWQWKAYGPRWSKHRLQLIGADKPIWRGSRVRSPDEQETHTRRIVDVPPGTENED